MIKVEVKTRPRGSFRSGVCSEGTVKPIMFTSWLDACVVNCISNADSSEVGEVKRKVGSELLTFKAPVIISEYNKRMQGVDRLDQLRARFSICDGHSFKKWYKKLAMGIIDLARVNAYQSRLLVVPDLKFGRDPHRTFISQLAADLIKGNWKKAPVLHAGIRDNDSDSESETPPTTSTPRYQNANIATLNECNVMASSILFPNQSKKRKRQCVVCRWEQSEVIYYGDTTWDMTHKVSLCTILRTTTLPVVPRDSICNEEGLTCWEKYHIHYLAKDHYSGCSARPRSSSSFSTFRRAEQRRISRDY